jgi:hypothetical protein
MTELSEYRDCPKCGKPVKADATCCGHCWTRFSSEVATPTTALPPPHRAAEQLTPRWSTTTRYLCAAAHLDVFFRSQVLSSLWDQKYCAIAPSPGIDLPTVLHHCLAARKRKLYRDLAILLCLFLGALIGIKFPFFALFFQAFAIFGIVLAEEVISRFQIVAKSLLKGNYDPQIGEHGASPSQQVLQGIDLSQKANIFVYKGFSPFVGAGIDIGGWSFALSITRGKDHPDSAAAPQDFAVTELYRNVEQALSLLNLREITLSDRVYVNGSDLRGDRRFLPDPYGSPKTHLGQDELQQLAEHPEIRARYFKVVQVVAWEGEIIVSIFLRFQKIGNSLYAEANYFLLPPLKESFHRVDAMHKSASFHQVSQVVFLALIKSFFLWSFVSLLLIGSLVRKLFVFFTNRRRRKEIYEDQTFNYGADNSLRQSAATGSYQRYFQKLDKEMCAKIIERQVLDSIIDFLDERGIDTSELRERQTTILNHGVIVSSGGTLRTGAMAVGERAKAAMLRLGKAEGRSRQTAES